MLLDLQQPWGTPIEMKAWLESTLPKYEYIVRGKHIVVKKTAWRGVSISPKKGMSNQIVVGGAGAPPSMAAALPLNLSFLLGILPGLIFFLIFWAVTKGTVKEMQAEVSQHIKSHYGIAGGQVAAALPAAPAAPAAATFMPGTPVSVTAGDGNLYPATVADFQNEQYLCTFDGGAQDWYPAGTVVAR
jgi:hypothetical protein